MCLAFGAVVFRLADIQWLQSERYAGYGESQRVRKVDLPAERGAIFDRQGRELAMSIRQPTVWANPKLVDDPRGTARALAPVLDVGPAQLEDKLDQRRRGFVYLARKVDDEVASRVKDLGLAGVFLLDESERFLPAGALAAPLLGTVGLDNQGLAGLELQFDKLLSGRPGRLIVERDPTGGDIPGGLREYRRPVRGDDLVLTVDRSLQFETERALGEQIASAKAKGGVAIVMDSGTGEVLALANLVAEGPNGARPGPAAKNLALNNVYEPGSVNKLITVAGALEEGLFGPGDHLYVPGTIKVGNHVFSEHDPHPPVSWSITDIMTNSSNVGSIMIGQKLGKERLDAYLRAFGFGRRTGLGVPGESAGLLLDPADWYTTSIGTVPIGQGIAVTAMQMLAAYNTVANGGTYVAPKLVRATVDAEGRRHATRPSPRRRVVSERTAAQINAMLAEVVRVGTGTLAAIDGYTVAGKTGTARKPLEGARGYAAGAYVSSFAGFVPVEKPALSAIVILDEPTPIYGGLVAAPVFARVARYGLRQFRIPPPPVRGTGAEVPKVSPGSAHPVGEAVAEAGTGTGAEAATEPEARPPARPGPRPTAPPAARPATQPAARPARGGSSVPPTTLAPSRSRSPARLPAPRATTP